MAMRGALLAAAVLLRGCRGQQTTVLTVGGLFPTSQGDATNEDFNDDRRQAEAALAAINAVNADASVLPGVQLAFLAQDIAALRTLNSNSENFFQRQMAEEVAGDIAAVFRQADAVGVVGAGWSSDVKVLAPALGSLPLVSHSASASVLSNATLYPNFARTIPSDGAQSVALADAVRFFGWSRIGVISCDDLYCRGLANGVREELSGSEFTVSFEHEVGQFLSEGEAEGAISNVVAKMEQQCEGNEDETGVVLLITHQVETLMGLANANTNLRVAWLGSESVGNLPTFGYPEATSSGMMALRIGGVDESHAHWVSLTGVMPQASDDMYCLNVYDAVWSLAYALDATMSAAAPGERWWNNTAAIMSSIRQVTFEGASGDVRFDANEDRVGTYDIVQCECRSSAVLGGVSLTEAVVQMSTASG